MHQKNVSATHCAPFRTHCDHKAISLKTVTFLEIYYIMAVIQLRYVMIGGGNAYTLMSNDQSYLCAPVVINKAVVHSIEKLHIENSFGSKVTRCQ